jgi:plasmid maintenance system killer protein
MIKLLIPILIFLAACSNKQGNKEIVKNENTNYLVTLDGIGSVKTDMSQEELEKLLNKKVPLTNLTDTISGSWEDSARVQYKGADIKLSFVRSQTTTIDSFYLRITRMETSSPLCKTQNGIGIGASKQQIIDAFEDNLLIMAPDYADTTYTTRSKTMYSIKVRENWEGREMIFYLKDKKVYAIEVGNFYDDSE